MALSGREPRSACAHGLASGKTRVIVHAAAVDYFKGHINVISQQFRHLCHRVSKCLI